MLNSSDSTGNSCHPALLYIQIQRPKNSPESKVAEDILSLIKFCSVDTGLKILNSQTLRWSSPHLFNDPFELNHTAQTDFTPDTLVKGMIKEAINLLFGPNEPTGKSNRLVAAISRWRDEERFASEEEAEAVLNQLFGQMAQQQQETIDKYLQAWRQFSSALRICCFSDKPGNMAAWQRYGDNHSGIALKFAAGEDFTLHDPKRVHYSTTPPFITNLKEQVAVSYGKQPAPSSDGFVDKLLSKNRDDSAEREYRCFDVERGEADGDEQLWYTNKTFKTHELKAIYIGLGTRREDKEAVINLVKADYKNTRVFQAEAVSGCFEVDFVPLGIR